MVDPSARVAHNSEADERHQTTLEEFSVEHADRFDVAFAVFVMEHVADPVGFTEAAARVLKPRGVLLALTLNQWHYFGLTTWATSRLGLEEWLLRQVRDPREVGEYHFHTEYRINTIRSVSRHLERGGFADVEFRMWDPSSPLRALPASQTDRAGDGMESCRVSTQPSQPDGAPVVQGDARKLRSDGTRAPAPALRRQSREPCPPGDGGA